ncbi:hypothetical protein CH267_16475 [Rhodococcus sp. 06-621-2]|nr:MULTISPECIES: MmcQ/YjbR family DNA-binding protein [unclassified Rhodococcus (in: high G+C Gram-positive bacteria)]OZC53790.1 hypothetical protein CH267_16475 [Rhodococcus sp. 06-621-2]OZC89190.1 hypothetical protein CH282_04265 [Rhodococcus sp. 06-418-1B]
MSDYPDVPESILKVIRAVCSRLPETVEERAWTGVRWRVRTRTFAHVLVVEPGRPASYADAAGLAEPATVLTFRSEAPELDVLLRSGPPFFATPWGQDTVGMLVDDADEDELSELLTDSYCLLAPRKLAESVDRPGV